MIGYNKLALAIIPSSISTNDSYSNIIKYLEHSKNVKRRPICAL